MHFFMEMRPPTATAQEHSVKMVHGRPVFFDPPNVKDAKELLIGNLVRNKPEKPLTGPIELTALWLFPKGNSHRHGEWRTTKPDTDNLQKLLKDCMTLVGYWKDDAQVVSERVQKCWSDDPTGIYIEVTELEDGNHREQKSH